MSETLLSEDEARRLAEILQGLASPVRLRILQRLRIGPSLVGELVDDLNLGQTTVSNHLRTLRHLDLVSSTRDGRTISYALADDHVATVIDQAIFHLSHTDAPDGHAH